MISRKRSTSNYNKYTIMSQKELGILILINPQRVFNFDKSQFLLAKKKGTVLGPVNCADGVFC